MLGDFVRLHVEKRLRRPDNYTAAFERLVKPAIGDVPIYRLRRSHIATMLNAIEGDVMADRTLAYLGSALSWQATQDDDFSPPRLNGLRRVRGDRGRERVLDDDELRVIWRAAEGRGSFGAALRFLLLTGQRRGDVYGMQWSELHGAVWTIPASRYKTGLEHVVPLSEAALAIVEAQPKRSELVFSGRTGRPLSTGGTRKRRFDASIHTPIAPWTLHDLRRTARTLMGRADVRPDVAERVIGHAVGKAVERIYDRHRYLDEKRAALEALAAMVDRILHPPGENVVALRQGERAPA
jgi:integrase